MIIANPFTGQVLNANPEGHNQYVNPDGPSRKRAFFDIMRKHGLNVPGAWDSVDGFDEDATVRTAHKIEGNKHLYVRRNPEENSIRMDFENLDTSDHFGSQPKLTVEGLALARKISSMAKDAVSEGFKLRSAASDDKRSKIYAKHLSRMGLKKISEDPQEGELWG